LCGTQVGEDAEGAGGEGVVEGGQVAGAEAAEEDRVRGETYLFGERLEQVRQVFGDLRLEVARCVAAGVHGGAQGGVAADEVLYGVARQAMRAGGFGHGQAGE
jgi:hypothetical protein